MSDTIFDVAIIGAGPAGLSAAKKAARGGLSVVVLEEHAKPGEPVHCGECLSSFATRRMGLELPEEVIALHVKGIRVVFPDNSSLVFREEGYDLEKHLFEQYLAVKAQGAGAQLKTSSRVVGMKRTGGIWTISTLGGEVKARAVIDASGFQSVASEFTGLNTGKFKTVMGAQYYMEDVPNDGYIEFFLWPRLAPEGYLWIIPKKGGRANVGLVTTDAPNAHKYLKQFVKEKGLEGKKIIKPFGGAIPASGPLPQTYGDGLLLIGDAAGFTSPMFEGGTQLALKSGELAAQTLVRALGKNPRPMTPDINDMGSMTDASKEPAEKKADPLCADELSEYENAWREEFPPYEKLLAGKREMYALGEEGLNRLARVLPGDVTDMGADKKALIALKALVAFGPGKVMNVRSALETFAYSTGEMYGW
ncbi:MAG: NAD(P)/FAD-dependent oxidoreductase [Candidatus Micrarchaeota archaeon]